MEKFGYKFSFGPWNIHEGADPFGPPVRKSINFINKLKFYKQLDYDEVQFHDDDAVPELDKLSPDQIRNQARELKRTLADQGLTAEFVAPRLWEHPITVDGAYTANDPKTRAYAIDRSKKAADIAFELGTDLMVLWLAREGTYMREAKDIIRATEQLVKAVDTILDYSPKLRIAIEPKPNEPMDTAFLPTMGHALALGFQSKDPARVGVLMESAHSILANLDPADEIGFALTFKKLWSVHLNDQNGIKYDQDRSFGSVNLRRAFNQVNILDQNRFWEIGTIGMDVKAIRTQPDDIAVKHLRNSMQVFLQMVELSRALDRKEVAKLIAERDYEELDLLILNHLLGR